MKKEILFWVMLLSSSLYSQNSFKDTIYVIIDSTYNEKTLSLKKENGKYLNVTIFDYNNKNQKIKKSKQKYNSKTTKIYPKPSIYNYTNYYSIDAPKHIASIKNLKTFTIQDLSKNQSKIINNQIIIFIEKLSNYSYNLWTMNVSYQE